MAITAGTPSLVSVASNMVEVNATAVTGETGPVNYQWYKSTTTGFTPGGGNIISGATTRNYRDSAVWPQTTFYYKLQATDTGAGNTVVTYTPQLVAATPVGTLSLNSFGQQLVLGMTDLKLNMNT